MIASLALILLAQLSGEILARGAGVPIPGPVIGGNGSVMASPASSRSWQGDGPVGTGEEAAFSGSADGGGSAAVSGPGRGRGIGTTAAFPETAAARAIGRSAWEGVAHIKRMRRGPAHAARRPFTVRGALPLLSLKPSLMGWQPASLATVPRGYPSCARRMF